MEPGGIMALEGDGAVDGKTAVTYRTEQLDAFVAPEGLCFLST
jgi:hypothetical protein